MFETSHIILVKKHCGQIYEVLTEKEGEEKKKLEIIKKLFASIFHTGASAENTVGHDHYSKR